MTDQVFAALETLEDAGWSVDYTHASREEQPRWEIASPDGRVHITHTPEEHTCRVDRRRVESIPFDWYTEEIDDAQAVLAADLRHRED